MAKTGVVPRVRSCLCSAKWLVLMMMAWSAGCGQGGSKQESAPAAIESTARAGLAALRARSGSSLPAGAAHIRATAGTLVPEPTATSKSVTARVVLPSRANGQIHVEDAATGAGIDIALVGATNSVAQVVDGYVVYPKGQASGAIYERAEPSGVEDYVAFDARPASPSIAYDVALGSKVAGLRLVGNQLEMLDAGGTPRLRVAPPSIVGSAGEQADALLAVEGCAVDTNPAGPWGRTVTPPGAKRCRVRVSWAVDAVSYPALLDPRWQTTGSLSVARQDHNLIYLPLTGKVLAVGGRSSPTSTTGLSSAELYDKNSGTWSATSSMSGGRWSASATLLGSSSNGTTSQKVLVAGGINGSASLTTAQLYNQTAGTWAAAGTLNAARHLHTATLLNDGRVLVCGGMTGSTVLTSAALYNPASGSGSWAATTGPIPPPGWRFGTATLIATANQQLNGKVLLAGGNNGTSTISAVFLFDPAQSAFSTLASMPSPREGHQAVVLSDGRILFAGGKNGSSYLASSVIFDPSWGPGNWTAAGNMTSARWGHAMNLLPSWVLHLGLVLVSGGSNGTSTLSSTEYWNGTNWATDGVMVAPVQQHVSVAFGNSILIAGGAINNGSTTVSAAEVYDPSIALGCTSGSQCASGFCVSGVCCDSSCNSGCGSCNLAGHLGICTPLTSGTVCRALAGICDAAETCDGSSLACPNDAFQPTATICRASAGVCDVAETCTGASAACPQDGFASAATVCRPAAGACDRAENCTGTGASCPADLKVADGTACNDGNACTRNDICTAGTCGGTAYSCDDGLACSADSCNGDGTCTFSVTAGNCLIAGSCYASGAESPTNQCQQCLPGSSQTGWSPKSNGTACDDHNACTQTDSCQSGACAGTNPVQCTASDQCHSVGSCTAATGACTNPAKPDGTACDDGDFLTTNDMCQSGQCVGTATHGGQQLSGQTLPAQTGAPRVGPVPGDTVINMSIALQLQNPTSWQELQDLAQQVSDPFSQKYRQFLGVDDFAARFGASPTDYQHVQDWATSHGLAVTKTFANNLVVAVSGSAQAIQQALYVHLDYYSRPDGTQFYGPDRQPSLDPPTGQTLPVFYIGNLDNMFVPKTLFQINRNNFNDLVDTSGLGNGNPNYPYPFKTLQSPTQFLGDDYRNAYAYDPNLNSQTTLTGAGQCVGLVSTGDFSLGFMQKYWTQSGRTNSMPQITAVYAGAHQACNLSEVRCFRANAVCGPATCQDRSPGGLNWCTQLQSQGLLDPTYEAVCGVDYPNLPPGKSANDLTRCQLACPSGAGCGPNFPPDPQYGGNNGTPTGSGCAINSVGSEMNLDIQMVLAMAPAANIITYSGSETISPLADMASTKPPCLQLSASTGLYDDRSPKQNQSVDQLVAELAVQGQAFFAGSGDNGEVMFERVSSPFVTLVGETLLWTNQSGGIRYELPEPLSGGFIMDGNTPDGCNLKPALVPIPWYQLSVGTIASSTCRNVPDVSIVGSNIGVAVNGSAPGQSGGTSASSPLWAAFWALANEESVGKGLGPIGTANPVLYAIGQTPAYGVSFNDIVQDPNDSDDGVDGVTCTGTSCDNTVCTDSQQAKFPAGPGYDLATGWGSPKYGLIEQLASTTPVPVQNVVVGGFQSACVVRSNNSVSCWGDNSFDELGNPLAANPQLTPFPVAGLPWRVTSIAAGWDDACAILVPLWGGRLVYCWGGSDQGRLGGGSIWHGPTPVEVSQFDGATAVAMGDRHACVLMPPDGRVLCAGNNTRGQLGNGTITSSSTPVQALTGAKAIAAGGDTTCAIVGNDSQLECWGAQLGHYSGEDDPNYPNQPRPYHMVPSLVYADATQVLRWVAAVAVGQTEEDDFCVISALDGSVRCYGENAWGGVGDGTMGNHGPAYPTAVIASCDPGDADKPLLGAKQIAVGEGYSCALLSGGTVECWGLNSEGQLGDGTTVSRACPARVFGSVGMIGVTALSASGTVTCSVAPRGVYCWGAGILGDGGPAHESDKPVAVKSF